MRELWRLILDLGELTWEILASIEEPDDTT